MTNRELSEKLGNLIRQERRITNEILALIQLGLKRRAYLELGFSSMFDWLTKGFGYSNAAAQRRIEAARLVEDVPEAAEMLETGQLSLSNLARAQTVLNAEERATGTKISSETKEELVNELKGKSTDEAERLLAAEFPQGSKPKDTKRAIDENSTRYSLTLDQKVCENLTRAKELLSHTMPTATDAEVIAFALDFLLARKDPLRNATSEGGCLRSFIVKSRIDGVAALIGSFPDKSSLRCCQLSFRNRAPDVCSC